ncbi:nucleotide sugar dehydrogenase [Bacillota bacterium LX-D]|nr:nucleotide sugar dehydrogenase [Bacillota bacterium LX-D]
MLQTQILTKEARVGVVGLGYVGLPLALLCRKKGFQVLGIDVDKSKIDSLNCQKSYLSDIEDTELPSPNQEQIQFAWDYQRAPECNIFLICVPTPLYEDESPNYSYLFFAIDALASQLTPQQLIIVESTISPGTTVGKILPRLQKKGLEVGRDFYLAFSPERVDPGNPVYKTENTPKIVSGVTPKCCSLAESFYQKLGIETVPVSIPAVAELAKLLENTYRDVNIALVNEMAEFCRLSGVDIQEVIQAAATKPFGFQPFYPGPGVGGHCIPKDNILYTTASEAKGKIPYLAKTARAINAQRPLLVVERIKNILESKGKKLKDSSIALLGVTYKKDVNDLRESPAVQIIKLLLSQEAKVSYHDPWIKQLTVEQEELKSSSLTPDFLKNQDLVVLVTAHSSYDLNELQRNCPCLLDAAYAYTQQKAGSNIYVL